MNIVVRKLGLVLLGIAIGLMAAEATVRWLRPQRVFSVDQSPRLFRCFEKGTYYWVRLRNNASCVLHSNFGAFPDTTVQTNRVGLRSPEITIPKPSGISRILFVGDSFTMGWGVEEEQSYPRVVEQLLKRRFPDKTIEVINAGVPATGPGYYYLFIKNELEMLDADLVVLGLYVFDDLFYGTSWSDWGGTDERGLPDTIESRVDRVDREGNIRPIVTGVGLGDIPFLNRSHLAVLFARQVLGRHRQAQSVMAPTCVFWPACRLLDSELEKTDLLLRGTIEMLRERQIPLFVVMIPAGFQFDHEKLALYGVLFSPPVLDLERPHRRLRQLFDAEGVPRLDLLPVFRQRDGATAFYFESDDHWTSAGHAVAADVISGALADMITRASP